MHLSNWKAARAGAAITVKGTDKATGREAKIVGVVSIHPTADAGKSGYLWAKDKNGDMHQLALG